MGKKKYQHGKCTFQDKWMTDEELKPWIQKVPNNVFAARCRFCPASLISLSSMGRQALTSHMVGTKHKKAASMSFSPSMYTYAKNTQHQQQKPKSSPSTSSNSCESSSTHQTQNLIQPVTTFQPEPQQPLIDIQPLGQSRMKKYLLNEEVTKAEIIWCLNTVMTHSSFRAAAAGVSAFKMMFGSCDVAKKIELQRTKIGYTIMFGLGPYFRNELIKTAQQCSSFVILFDESMNKVSLKQQMDVSLRFWDSAKDEVQTRYLTSEFLHSSKAADLQKALISAIKPLSLRNLLQVSMDGPNVNIKLLKDLKVYLAEHESTERTVVEFGSCGLHTINNSFKAGMTVTDWQLVTFLRALYNFFKDSPTRRGEYIDVTGSNIFPKKFCSVRWVENGEIAQRAIDILPNIKKFVENGKESKNKGILPKTYQTITEAVKDPLLGAKLAFFKTLACDVEPFLREFQTDWPYTPFLYTVLNNLVRNVMKRFVKPDEVKLNVDIDKEDNLLSFKQVDLGFATKSEISKVKGAKEADIIMLRRNAKKACKALVKEVLERSPLKFEVTKYLSSLDPKISTKPEGIARFDKLVEYFVDKSWITGTKADLVARQFKILVEVDDFKKASSEFRRSKCRLDKFWMDSIKKQGSEELKDLTKFIQTVLILSHGNAHVERGFSINKECLIENLREDSLVGLRTVYDGVLAEGGLQNIIVNKSMIMSVRNSHAKYKEARLLQESNMVLGQNRIEEERKRKMKLINEIKIKKAKLQEDANAAKELFDEQIMQLSKEL